MLDIFFLSYNEPFADKNFELLQMFAPTAKRVQGVKGIFNAHQECARRSNTSHFYVLDADAVIDEEFTFQFTPDLNKEAYPNVSEAECVYIWYSRNPINDLLYGYGGAKLFPRKKLLEATTWTVDMTTTLGAPIVPKVQVSNVTAFDTDPYNAWKSAFRECTKLASAVIPNGDNADNEYRLKVWTTRGRTRPFGQYCIDGAIMGQDFGTHYKNDNKALEMINDFDWLNNQFKDTYNLN